MRRKLHFVRLENLECIGAASCSTAWVLFDGHVQCAAVGIICLLFAQTVAIFSCLVCDHQLGVKLISTVLHSENLVL